MGFERTTPRSRVTGSTGLSQAGAPTGQIFKCFLLAWCWATCLTYVISESP